MKITRRTIKAIVKEIVQVPTPTFPDKYVHLVEEEVTEEMLENMISVLPLWEEGEYEQVETLIQDLHKLGPNQIHTLMIAAEEMKNYGQINDHAPEWVIDYFHDKFWGDHPYHKLNAITSQSPAIDETKRRLRRIIRETLEDEGFLAGLLKSGEISMIQQAITLAEDMNMGLLDLPWESVPLQGATVSMGPAARQFDFELAGIVIDQVESGMLDIGSDDRYLELKTSYETMEALKDKKLKWSDKQFHDRVVARTSLKNAALRLLKELTA